MLDGLYTHGQMYKVCLGRFEESDDAFSVGYNCHRVCCEFGWNYYVDSMADRNLPGS